MQLKRRACALSHSYIFQTYSHSSLIAQGDALNTLNTPWIITAWMATKHSRVCQDQRAKEGGGRADRRSHKLQHVLNGKVGRSCRSKHECKLGFCSASKLLSTTRRDRADEATAMQTPVALV